MALFVSKIQKKSVEMQIFMVTELLSLLYKLEPSSSNSDIAQFNPDDHLV